MHSKIMALPFFSCFSVLKNAFEIGVGIKLSNMCQVPGADMGLVNVSANETEGKTLIFLLTF